MNSIALLLAAATLEAGPEVHKPWKEARWMSFGGPTGKGTSAAVVVLDHPQGFRHRTPWYLIGSMPYFSPAVLYRAPSAEPRKS